MSDITEKDINALLESVWRKRSESSYEADFNMFKALGIEDKEVIICRFMGELLKIRYKKNEGTSPLFLFFDKVLKEPLPKDKKLEVILEDRIDGSRRVDIVIKTNNAENTYPIEVKIGAGDQPNQLYDYYRFYFGDDKSHKIWYLTPTGWFPSKESTFSSDGKNNIHSKAIVKTIAFTEEVYEWLKECKEHVRQSFLKTIIGQFMEVIMEMGEIEKYKDMIGICKNGKLKDGFTEEKQREYFKLLKNSDTLLKEIRRAHILEHLPNLESEGFEYEKCSGSDIDSHALIEIKYEKTAVAWICVDTNIYLCCKKKKVDVPKEGKGKHLEGRDEYYWQYISPAGIGKTFNMKDYSEKINNEIEIEPLLNEIDCT